MLHANSWRSAYRGILRDEFLDGALDENRRVLWGSRLSDETQQNQLILVDEEAGEIRAFACAFIDADPEWGTLLDNLHVEPRIEGPGLGSTAGLSDCSNGLAKRIQTNASLVGLRENLGARRFYERLGGVATACEEEPALDGTRVNAVRYFWDQLSDLAAGADLSLRIS